MNYRHIIIAIIVILLTLCSNDILFSKTFSNKRPAEILLSHNLTLQPLVQLKIIIDNVNNGIVRAYITPEEFKKILNKGYTVNWKAAPIKTVFDRSVSKTTGKTKANEFSYPSYSQLSDELEAIALSNPSICSLINGGLSVEGRPLWWVKLSDNIDAEEFEPEVHFIGGIHGDEPVGTILCVELVRYLTTNYSTDPRIQDIIDSTEIWIMPLMNPDGYMESERWNANGKDLNRSFPVFTPDTPETIFEITGVEPEVEAIMSWSFNHSSVLSANFHAGALVVNYPFDYTESLCPDNELFEYISRQYASQNIPMYNSTDPAAAVDGTIRGSLWYRIEGGMQDWAYLATGSSQVTVELSSDKTPDSATLQALWNDNRESMLTFIETVHCGVEGLVTDVQSGTPLAASINVDGNGHSISTDPDLGDYHRMLLPGNYKLIIDSDGYISQSHTVIVADNSTTELNIQLVPDPSSRSDVGCFIIAAEK